MFKYIYRSMGEGRFWSRAKMSPFCGPSKSPGDGCSGQNSCQNSVLEQCSTRSSYVYVAIGGDGRKVVVWQAGGSRLAAPIQAFIFPVLMESIRAQAGLGQSIRDSNKEFAYDTSYEWIPPMATRMPSSEYRCI
jgi:hypothetical protein